MALRKKVLGLAAIAFVATLSFGAIGINASASEPVETAKFEMVAGAQVRTTDPSGIRFLTDVNETYKTELAKTYSTETYTWVWGTELTFTDVEENSWTVDAVTEKWLDNDTRWYTTLVGIPDTDYLTEITAESYVKIYDAENTLVDTKTVSNAQTRSIAYSASWALNAGCDDDILYDYTKAIPNTSVELDKESESVVAGTEIQLNANAQPAGYGVAWRSSDTSVATVDKNGKVTAINAGEAIITATLGNASDSYQLEVTESPESQLIKTFYYRKDASTHIYHENFVNTKGVVSADNFAYGSSNLGDGRTNSSVMYMTLSSEYMGTLFADAKIAEIKFDIVLSVDAKRIAICSGTTDKFVLADNKSTSSVELNGVTYYTYTVTITRENYETYGKDSDMTLRYIHLRIDEDTVLGSGSSTFFFIDNLQVVEGEIKLYENKLITGFSNKNDGTGTNHQLTTNNEVNGKKGVYGITDIPSSNSGTMYMTISKDYIAELLAIEGVTEITFDIIISESKQLQLNGNNANFYNGDYYTVSPKQVGDVTYYTYHVRITKEYYDANSTKAFAFRYTGHPTNIPGTTSMASKFFYVDNLALIKA